MASYDQTMPQNFPSWQCQRTAGALRQDGNSGPQFVLNWLCDLGHVQEMFHVLLCTIRMLKYMTSKVHKQFHPTNIFFIMMLLVLLVTLYPPENPPANPQNSVSGYL